MKYSILCLLIITALLFWFYAEINVQFWSPAAEVEETWIGGMFMITILAVTVSSNKYLALITEQVKLMLGPCTNE